MKKSVYSSYSHHAITSLLTLLLGMAVQAREHEIVQEREIGLICELGGSPEYKRTPNVRLSWRQQNVPEGSRVDWTVYKDGFERGGFASFGRLLPGEKVRPKFARRELQGLRPFRLRLVDVYRASDERYLSAILLENLEPGINYRFRLAINRGDGLQATEVIVCPVPACIADAE